MEYIERFTLGHTKAELFDEALRRRILLVPVSNTADIFHSDQLRAREYWVKLAHPECGREFVYPGAFAKLSETPICYRRRPPLLGEHTHEVLGERRVVSPTSPALIRHDSASGGPLAGLKVLDFHWAYAGPAVTRYLADYGATVVRVESSKKLDAYRTVGPFKDGKAGADRSGGFSDANMGKYDLSLNLKVPEAQQIALGLVKWADIVVENFSPKVMSSWGMDYQSLRKIKPGLIMLSSCLNGQSRPAAMLAGYGNTGAVMAGFGELTGWPVRAPTAPYAAYTDYVSPKFAIAALLAAVDHKRHTGEGQYIDFLKRNLLFTCSVEGILDYTVNERIQTRTGNALAEYPPNGVYPCAG